MSNLDFNDAGEQRSFDVIQDNTIVTFCATVHPGGAGDDQWLTKAKDQGSEHINLEFTVTDGPHAKRKIFTRMTVSGTTPNHAEAAGITRRTIKAMLESARGIKPNDNSDAAKAGRQIKSYGDLNGLCFIARLGVEPPKGTYAAKNFIKAVITPDKVDWKKPEPPPSNGGVPPGAMAGAGQAAAPPATQPANPIPRPRWAT